MRPRTSSWLRCPDAAVDVWRRDFEVLRERRRPGALRVLAGDFNATLDRREMGDLVGSGLQDTAEAAGTGLVPTWPAGGPVPGFMTLDHIVADRRLR